jgi:hypothetical protein
MNDRDLSDLHSDRIATTEARLEGFNWVILGQNPPERQPEAVTVVNDRLVFKPRLAPVA